MPRYPHWLERLCEREIQGKVVSVETLLTGGVGAITVLVFFLALILNGKLHTDGEFDREVARGDRLEKALADMTKAKEVSDERADAAVRASSLIAEAFSSARDRRRDTRGHSS